MQALPITIKSDAALDTMRSTLEMWINFETLKADWYAHESRILSFDFSFISALDEHIKAPKESAWILGPGYIYQHEISNLSTIALIEVTPLMLAKSDITLRLKEKLKVVVNAIAVQHKLAVIP